ncbi:MAG: hypothetical protein GY757_33515 [bacterium]|nr:hypothetical protein [bacterium]
MSFKKVFVFLLTAALISGLTLFGTGDEKPLVKKGAKVVLLKGSLRSWADVNKTPLNLREGARKMRPILNFENPRKFVKKSDAEDPVVQSDFGLTREQLATEDPIANFAGMNLNSNGAGWPPDTTGDVGSTYFVQAVNSSMAIYRKSDGQLMSSATFDDFFGGTGISGTPCDDENNGDPLVLYDQYNQRWFVLDFAWESSQNDGSYFSIAASKTSDPTGDWWQYAFRADDTLMDDYPKAGVWHDGIYITANMFQFSGSYQGAKVWALKTPELYQGTITSQYVYDTSDEAWSIMPSNARGTTPPASTEPNYMFSMDCDEFGGSSTDGLYVWKYDVDWTNSSNTTWTGPTKLSSAAFTVTGTGVPQQGSSVSVDSLAGRLMYTAMYRKYSTYNSVYLSHVADYSSRRAMRWYEVRISSGGTPSIYQQSTFSPDSNHRWMGSIAADKWGSVALAYSISSSSMYPAIAYTGRVVGDTLSTLPQGEKTLIAGTGAQTSYSRWGDYSTLSVDPSDDETFWYTQEYYTSTGTNWQTRIGSFKISNIVDTTPPVISSVASSDITNTTATITWTTDEDATSVVNYGTSSSYGSTETVSGYDTTHSVTLTGLTADTTYHFEVVSADSSANESDSTDYTFTTTNIIVIDTIPEAVDQPSMTFTHSGDADWSYDGDVYYYDNDSAKSGTITHSQTSTVTTTANYTSAYSVKFYWKVSSESGYDYLRFYIDGTLQDQIAGTVDWAQQSYDVSAGSHTLAWTYYKDGSVSSGSDCGWFDKLEFEEIIVSSDLADGVDYPSLTFTTSGTGDWVEDTSVYYYDNDSIVSPTITHNQSSSVETDITGFNTIKFYWKVSSESGYDYLRFYVDDVLQEQVSGTVDWTQKTYYVSDSAHTLKWTYYKDGSVSSGSDSGWVDKLELSNGSVADPIAAALDTTGTFTLSGDEDWDVTTADYYYGSSSVVSPAALGNSQSSVMETTISGVTSVSFYWKVSSESGYDYLKFYIDDVLQDQIAGTTSWAQETYSVSSGSHTLKWEYDKDGSVSSGSDCGWVDYVDIN